MVAQQGSSEKEEEEEEGLMDERRRQKGLYRRTDGPKKGKDGAKETLLPLLQRASQGIHCTT